MSNTPSAVLGSADAEGHRSAQALAARAVEHVHVLHGGPYGDLVASVGVLPSIDTDDDIRPLPVDERVSVGEAVRAQFLDDVNLDLQAHSIRDDLKVLRPHSGGHDAGAGRVEYRPVDGEHGCAERDTAIDDAGRELIGQPPLPVIACVAVM